MLFWWKTGNCIAVCVTVRIPVCSISISYFNKSGVFLRATCIIALLRVWQPTHWVHQWLWIHYLPLYTNVCNLTLMNQMHVRAEISSFLSQWKSQCILRMLSYQTLVHYDWYLKLIENLVSFGKVVTVVLLRIRMAL